MMTAEKLEELLDEPASQVKLSVEVLTQNIKLSAGQRRALLQLVTNTARELNARALLIAEPGIVNVRCLRSSSSTGDSFLDIYSEE